LPVLTPEQVGAYWILAGGPRDVTAEAISESYVESGHDTDAVSSVGCLGLWQGCPPQASYRNPLVNAQMAVSKWRDGGGSFTKHWRNFQAAGTEAKRLAYMPRATRAANRIVRMNTSQLRALTGGTLPAGFDLGDLPGTPLGPLGPNLGDLFGGGGGGGLLPDVPSPGDLIEGIGNIAEVLRGFLELTIEFSRKLTEIDTYKDAGKIFIGLMLLYIGTKRLFTITTGGN
jgi:hypothetical protein